MNIKTNFNFSFDDLDKWGLLNKAKLENLKDNILINENAPTKEVKESVEIKWRKKYNLLSDEKFREWLENAQLNQKKFMLIILRDWMWLNWCRNHFEKEVSEYFLKRKSSLDKVIYSIITVKEENIANELYIRIKEDEEPFWLIAKKYSSGPEKYSDGRVGPIALSNITPKLRNLLILSDIGELWKPKKLNYWWVILKLENKFSFELDNELKDKLFLELGEKYLNKIIINK
tara:strand:+ start:916 stop:1608 length:693 start_codon:yes stop_codon:yes gene_type:complete